MMSSRYTSDEIDQIEDEIKKLNLESEGVLIEKPISVEIVQTGNDSDTNELDIEVIKKPTNVEIIQNESKHQVF